MIKTKLKRIVLNCLAFIIGIIVAFYSELFFRKQIQNLYKWSTSNKIQFTGKDFYLPGNIIHYISFGLAFLIFYLYNKNETITIILKRFFLNSFIFIITIVGISYLDANIKLVECTACPNGIRYLRYNEIKYSLITGLSVFLAIFPIIIRLAKQTNKQINKT